LALNLSIEVYAMKTVVKSRIVAKPRKKRRLSLAQLLKGVTKKNRPGEIDWGAPVGREIW
jgi:antitoxin component of MazEF toxin-antitoxin module